MKSIKDNLKAKRTEINMAAMELTKTRYFQPGQTLPLVIEPAIDGVNLQSWVADKKAYLHTELGKHGAILFRNFNVNTPAKFEALAQTVSSDLFDEYGDLPREEPGAKVYGSTPYPADKSILYHNESSHMHRWPMKIWFYCVKPAEKGGATPIVDCRKVYQTLDKKLIARLTEKKLVYVRNFIDGLDVSWQQFFMTSKKESVEAYCRQAGIAFEWKGENRLTTRQLCDAVVKHPYTGEMVFFNQVQLHHISCLDPALRESMESMFQSEDLPRNVYYGDNTPIEDSVIAEISEVLEQCAVRFQWQTGDAIMVDNMMVAHSRDPFEGTRKLLVAMAEIMTQKEMQHQSA